MATPARSLPRGTPSARPATGRPSSSPKAPPSRTRARRRGATGFLVFAGFVVGLLVLGLVQMNVMVAETSFRMDELSGRISQLERRAENRRLAVARLSSPSRIGREAKRLGLVLPDPMSVVYLHAGKGQVTEGPAADARDGGTP